MFLLRMSLLWTLVVALAASTWKCVSVMGLWIRAVAQSWLQGAPLPVAPWPVLRSATTDTIGAFATYRLMSRVLTPIHSGKVKQKGKSSRMYTDGQVLMVIMYALWVCAAFFAGVYWYDASFVLSVLGPSGMTFGFCALLVLTPVAVAVRRYEQSPQYAARQLARARMLDVSAHRRTLAERSKRFAV